MDHLSSFNTLLYTRIHIAHTYIQICSLVAWGKTAKKTAWIEDENQMLLSGTVEMVL